MIIKSGTWTPVLWDSSFSNGEGQTYTTQEGSYLLVGGLVHFFGFLVVSSLGTLSTLDGARIGGLPYTSSTKLGSMSAGAANGLNITAGYSISGYIPSATTYISLQKWGLTTGSSGLPISQVSSAMDIKFSGSYEAG